MPVELLNIDCMEYMRTVPDKAFDLAIVDPPYGHGNNLIRKGNTRSKIATAKKHKPYDNSKPMPPAYYVELQRVSKHQIIWGANHFCDQFNAAGGGVDSVGQTHHRTFF